MATSQENIELLDMFCNALPGLDLPTAYQIRNLTVKRIGELEQAIIEQRDAFKKETLAKATELGLTAVDLFPPVPREKAPPKYAHPSFPEKTWSGKGKQPGWVKDAIAAGLKMDDLLIPTTDVDPDAGF